MHEPFTPPRKKSTTVVCSSDEGSEYDSEAGESDCDEEEGSRTTTPQRSAPKTHWVEIKRWNKGTMQMSEIDHQLDAILMQSFKDANYFAEHVSKSKTTDQCYWKESHVSYLLCSCDVRITFLFVKVSSLLWELIRCEFIWEFAPADIVGYERI